MSRSLVNIRLLGSPGVLGELVALVLDVEAVLGDGATIAPAPGLVVLLDPTEEDWAEALAYGVPVILVSGQSLGPKAVTEAVLHGADAVLHADSDLNHLVEAAQVLLAGGTLLDPHQTRALALAARGRSHPEGVPIALSHRERQILESIERGEVVKQTAIALGVTTKTVENTQSRLFCKLGARNRAQAITRAYALGLLTP